MQRPLPGAGASFWSKLRTDTETKQQLVTVALVALFVSTFEVLFFFNKVVPDIRSSVRAMVTPAAPSALPPVTRARLDAALQVLQENERRLIAANNASTVVYAVLILCLPALVVGGLVASSGALRTASWRGIRRDTAVMVASIVAFQLYFYFFSAGWRYPSAHQIVSDVTAEYRRRAAAAGDYRPDWPNELVGEALPFLPWSLPSSDADRLLGDVRTQAERVRIDAGALR